MALAAAVVLLIVLLAAGPRGSVFGILVIGAVLAGAWARMPVRVTLPRGAGASIWLGGGGESQVRQCFESLLGARFPSTKNSPEMPWLTSSRGFPLEIDGYSAKYRLGFEYQGPFHYRYNPLIGPDGEPVIAGLRDAWDAAETLSREYSAAEVKRIEQNLIDYPYAQYQSYLENDARKMALMSANARTLMVIPHTVVAAYYRGEFDLGDYVASRLADLKRIDLPVLRRKYVPALTPPSVDRSDYALKATPLEPSEANLRSASGGLRALKGSMGLIAYRPETDSFQRRKLRAVQETRPDLPMAVVRGLHRTYYLYDKTKSPDPETGLFYDASQDALLRVVAPKEWDSMESPPSVTKLVRIGASP